MRHWLPVQRWISYKLWQLLFMTNSTHLPFCLSHYIEDYLPDCTVWSANELLLTIFMDGRQKHHQYKPLLHCSLKVSYIFYAFQHFTVYLKISSFKPEKPDYETLSFTASGSEKCHVDACLLRVFFAVLSLLHVFQYNFNR